MNLRVSNYRENPCLRNPVFDSVHFPPVVKKYPFRGYGIYRLAGKIVEEFGFTSLEVVSMEKLPMKKDPRYV